MEIMERFQLDGRRALVTGSSRGIGRAIALSLAECGATVVVHGSGPSDKLSAALSEVRAIAPASAAVTGDLGAEGGGRRVVEAATVAVGDLDILVANASLQIRKPWLSITPEEAHRQMQVNFHATLEMIQAAAPAMQKHKWGRVLVVGSVQEARPHSDMAVYAASKSAMENLVRNLARQLAGDGVTVNSLSPGVIETDRNVEVLADPAYAAQVRAWIPSGVLGQPADCAGAAVLLCSDAGRYITGQTLFIDGGMKL